MFLLVAKGKKVYARQTERSRPGHSRYAHPENVGAGTQGYGISVRIEQMSKGVFRLNAGSLFLAIQRLERDGLIDGEWKPTENNRRAKYYTLTAKGRKRLDSETREWGRQVAAIGRILETS
jgi:PadR family transcriptional regulator PadR